MIITGAPPCSDWQDQEPLGRDFPDSIKETLQNAEIDYCFNSAKNNEHLF
jgi:hypothetical protein